MELTKENAADLIGEVYTTHEALVYLKQEGILGGGEQISKEMAEYLATKAKVLAKIAQIAIEESKVTESSLVLEIKDFLNSLLEATFRSLSYPNRQGTLTPQKLVDKHIDQLVSYKTSLMEAKNTTLEEISATNSLIEQTDLTIFIINSIVQSASDYADSMTVCEEDEEDHEFIAILRETRDHLAAS